MSTRNLRGFFSLTLLISLPIFILAALTADMVPEGLPVNHIGFLMVIAPITAAFILTYREDGLDSAKELLMRSFDHKRITRKIWYGPIFFLFPFICVSSQVLMNLIGLRIPETPISIVAATILFPVFIVFAVCEEVGWQGYAFDSMEERWKTLNASIILGVVLALWHVPLYFVQSPPGGLVWIVGQSLNVVVTRVLIVWIFNNTGKSVFSAILLHAVYNLCTMTLPFYSSPFGPITATIVTAVVVIFAIGVQE